MKPIRGASLFCAAIALAIALGDAPRVIAQVETPTLVQAADGSFWMLLGTNRHRVSAVAIPDETLLTYTESEPWVSSIPAPVDPLPEPVAVAPTVPAEPRVGEWLLIVSGTQPTLNAEMRVNAIQDNVPNSRSRSADGRWMAVDISVRNTGGQSFPVNRLHFHVKTADGFLIDRDVFPSTPPGPELQTGTLGPQQDVRGFLMFDVPKSQRPVSIVWQAQNNKQIVIAKLD